MKLDNRVRELRARFRMSQTELAEAIDVSRQTISLIERGDYSPSVVLALKMAKLFKEPVEFIFILNDGEEFQ
ncbi:putative transcriptional regulator [Paenibacillus algorifonticola]|uniref:Putative transcriptional regulator n=1 Tax=Paenibacillus algorifonticola TaxID=684063 RepID=A0A1I2IJX1_9BACL|nr:helix-turn-helix transcriptional regulator [Paenibacillus algorifonticola]SFF41943.1 putative transcriptional regulator [Paenibacillus algorifonticola]